MVQAQVGIAEGVNKFPGCKPHTWATMWVKEACMHVECTPENIRRTLQSWQDNLPSAT
jgi:hypothetical protein